MIQVKQTKDGDPMEFEVRVQVGNGATSHRVSVAGDTLESLANGREAAELVRASFEFLLEREPKESILRSFANLAQLSKMR